MSRNNVYKMSGLRCTNPAKARAERMDEQNGNRRMARQAKNDAKRGLTEIDQNVLNVNSTLSTTAVAEATHEQKLQERLSRLKAWREQKVAMEQKAKAKKKTPFLVPGVARSNKPSIDTNIPATSKQVTLKQAAVNQILVKPTSGRVTRSQAKKPVEVEKKWIITSNEPVKVKKGVNSERKENSFAPTGFIFTAPKEIAIKSLELQDTIRQKSMESPVASRTPQKPSSSDNEDIKISPLVLNHPWISTTRGSSSKKQGASVDVQSKQEPQSSPLLKKRPDSQRKSVVELSNPHALHFRALMASEGSRLTDLCNQWEESLLQGFIPEEEVGSVRTVIGQAQLLQRERFTQFAGLVNQFETKTGEKEITPTDLEGFWEMIYLQVSDVDRKFEDLSKRKDSGWVDVDIPEPQRKTRAAAKKKAPVLAAKSNMRAIIAAARKKQLAEKGCGSPLKNRRSSLLMSPMRSPMRTPGRRQSLRRSVLINSAKKPVFIVTDIVPSEEQETAQSNANSPTSKSSDDSHSPRRASRKPEADQMASPITSRTIGSEIDATPDQQKTYGRAQHASKTLSPKERLSAAFDALTEDSESSDRMTPLKVIHSPLKQGNSNAQLKSLRTGEKEDEPSPFSPRRSTRLRGGKGSAVARVSLLPVASISPVIPNEDLISFD